ncbi:hypothetical protein RI367_002134 [Sorochytrium milnesiophthora]
MASTSNNNKQQTSDMRRRRSKKSPHQQQQQQSPPSSSDPSSPSSDNDRARSPQQRPASSSSARAQQKRGKPQASAAQPADSQHVVAATLSKRQQQQQQQQARKQQQPLAHSPVAVSPCYAGATFQNSPAPDALPTPAFSFASSTALADAATATSAATPLMRKTLSSSGSDNSISSRDSSGNDSDGGAPNADALFAMELDGDGSLRARSRQLLDMLSSSAATAQPDLPKSPQRVANLFASSRTAAPPPLPGNAPLAQHLPVQQQQQQHNNAQFHRRPSFSLFSGLPPSAPVANYDTPAAAFPFYAPPPPPLPSAPFGYPPMAAASPVPYAVPAPHILPKLQQPLPASSMYGHPLLDGLYHGNNMPPMPPSPQYALQPPAPYATDSAPELVAAAAVAAAAAAALLSPAASAMQEADRSRNLDALSSDLRTLLRINSPIVQQS